METKAKGLTDAERIHIAKLRYEVAAHAMQTGVKFERELNGDGDTSSTGPKHLRVGVNCALVDSGALAELLFTKGIITEVEFREASAEKMVAEARTYEKSLSVMLGHEVELL